MRHLVVVALLSCVPALSAAASLPPVELHHVQFPEKETVQLPFAATAIAPAARLDAEVVYKLGQARIVLSFDKMKPAILFGGDVTCFVVWAVTRDGEAENLGELLTRKTGGKLEYQTGKKGFALMVTAEAFYLATEPSALVVFHNLPPAGGGTAPAAAFSFDRLAEAPRHHMDGIAHIQWDSSVPLELLQARKAFELAGAAEAAVYAPQIYQDAREALDSANAIANDAPKSRELLDTALIAVALSNEALNIARHRLAALEIERQLQARREETAALEQRATDAEAAAAEADRFATEVRREASLIREEAIQLRAEKDRIAGETSTLRSEKASLEENMLALRQEKSGIEVDALRFEQERDALAREKTAIEAEASRLRAEKQSLEEEQRAIEARAGDLQAEHDALSGRLQDALSHVAEAQESVRGWVVNLPDSLFDTDAAELRPEARTLLAKLSGILLVLPDRDVVVEGHTDASGSPDQNLDLSERRASAVRQFMQQQGLAPERLTSQGFGKEQPAADNDTDEGRRKNRRVEILIVERDRTVATY